MATSPGYPYIYDSEPPYLAVNTEVSAKYKGAFCEAKIKRVVQHVKCRVTFKAGGAGVMINHDNIKGTLRVGATVQAKNPSNSVTSEGTITKIVDSSQYTVVFDDGDETTLRRTSLCLKSGKHYAESESLDHLPLTNPEHFGNPVSMAGPRSRRSRRRATGNFGGSSYVLTSLSDDNEDNDSVEGDATAGSIDFEDDSLASNTTQPSAANKDDELDNVLVQKNDQDADWGRVVVVDSITEKRGAKPKENWFPALIVCPSAQDKNATVDGNEDFTVRSFKDNRFLTVPKKDVKDFVKSVHVVGSEANNTALRAAIEKAVAYMDKEELPPNWDNEVLLGLKPVAAPTPSLLTSVDVDATQDLGMASSELDSAADDEYEEDKETNDERDRFVAQLYKYMDERATPINKAPTVSGKDLDLYRLYRTVNKLGGYNKITNKNNWRNVYVKMGLPYTSDSSDNSAINQLKAAYKKYLLNFNDFYRKLGGFSAFVHNALPSRNSSSRPTRNERSWRERNDSGKEAIPAKAKGRKKSVTETEIVAKVEEVKVEEQDKDEKVSGETDEDKSSSRKNSVKKRAAAAKAAARKKPIVKPEPVDSDDGGPPDDDGPGDIGDNDSGDEAEANSKYPTIGKDVEVNVGDKIRVKYGKGKQQKVYDAKVVKAEKIADILKKRYFVHYNGWNTRYDEWIKRNRIVEVVRDKSPKRRSAIKAAGKQHITKGSPTAEDTVASPEPEVVVAPPTPTKRGRPPSAAGTRASTDNTAGKPVKAQPPAKTPGSSKRTRHRSETGSSQESVASSSQATSTQAPKLEINEDLDDSLSRFSKCDDSVSSASTLTLETKRVKPELEDQEKDHDRDSSDDKADTLDTERDDKSDYSEPPPVLSPAGESIPDFVALARQVSVESDAGQIESPIKPALELVDVKLSSPKRVQEDAKSSGDVNSKKSSDEDEHHKLSGKRKRGLKEHKERDGGLNKEERRKKHSPAKEASDDESCLKKKKSKRNKPKQGDEFDTPEKEDRSLSRKLKEKKTSKTSAPETVPEKDLAEKRESEELDLKGKRKRVTATCRGKESPSGTAPSLAEKKEEILIPKKRSKKDEEKASKKDDESLNAELSKLAEEGKEEKQVAESIQEVETEPEVQQPVCQDTGGEGGTASSFLLCAEEVPMSPVHQLTEESQDEQEKQPQTNSTFASAVAPEASVFSAERNSGIAGNSTLASAAQPKDTAPNDGHFTPPTTPDSLRSGTLSTSPPHEREVNDCEAQHSGNIHKSVGNSSSNSDCEGPSGDLKGETSRSTSKQLPYGSPPHMSEDSCSQGPHDLQTGGNSSKREQPSPATSPKKKIRGRKRTASTSEQPHETKRGERTPIKTRGAAGRRRAKLDLDNDIYSPTGASALDLLASRHQTATHSVSLANFTPNAFIASIVPISKYNFCEPIDENLEAEKRIQILQDRLQELRKTYMNIKSEVATIERRRKKAKKKDRNNVALHANSPNSKQSLDRSISSELSDVCESSRPRSEQSTAAT